jgi:hypothetical protein
MELSRRNSRKQSVMFTKKKPISSLHTKETQTFSMLNLKKQSEEERLKEKDIDELGDDILNLLSELDEQPSQNQHPLTPATKPKPTITEEEKQMNFLLN